MNYDIIGCGGAFIAEDNAQPCYLISEGETTIILDLGSGSLFRMARKGIDYSLINYIYLSHLDPDHVSDLPALIKGRFITNRLNGRQDDDLQPLQILVDQALYSDLKKWLDLVVYEVTPYYDIKAVKTGEKITVENFSLTTMPAVHAGVTAFCSKWESTAGEIFVYTGDTSYFAELVTFASGNDILLADCSQGEQKDISDRHMNARECGRLASQTGSKELILVHLYPLFKDGQVVQAAADEFAGIIKSGRVLYE